MLALENIGVVTKLQQVFSEKGVTKLDLFSCQHHILDKDALSGDGQRT